MEVRKRRNTDDDEPKVSPKLENFDIFTKLPSEYTEKSLSGGTMSIFTFLIMFILLIMESWNYINSPIVFSYNVDKDHDSKLRINVDLTVAMPCALIGADIVDQAGGTVESEASFVEEDVNFEMTEEGKKFHKQLRLMNEVKRKNFHSLRHLTWKGGNNYWQSYKSFHQSIQPGQSSPACRIYGSVYVSKMPGNFHVTAGKHVDIAFMRGHAHLVGFLGPSDYNFSHRIHHFSFGDPSSNILNPLDAEESIVQTNLHLFQYYIQVVATRIRTIRANVNTYQYAVREHNRTIDHNANSHGMPGIFMRYDMSPLQVNVTEDRPSFITFLVRLSAVIGGIFATSCFLHMVVVGFFIMLRRRYFGDALPLDIPKTVPGAGITNIS